MESLQAKYMPEMVVIWSIALYNYSSIAQRYFQSDKACCATVAEFGVERRNKHEAKGHVKRVACEIQFKRHCSCGFAAHQHCGIRKSATQSTKAHVRMKAV